MNRREFVRTGTTVATLASLSTLAMMRSSLASPAMLGPITIDTAVIDERFLESRAFGHVAQQLGARLLTLRGDVTALWRNTLAPRMTGGGGAIAGMTSMATLLCIEQLAKDHWWKVVTRIDHLPATQGTVSHRIDGHALAADRAGAMIQGGTGFAAGLATTLLSHHKNTTTARVQRVVEDSTQLSLEARRQPLVSWVISA